MLHIMTNVHLDLIFPSLYKLQYRNYSNGDVTALKFSPRHVWRFTALILNIGIGGTEVLTSRLGRFTMEKKPDAYRVGY